MVGSVAGPCLGPLLGGIIVSFASWRCVFYVQTGMTALGLVLSFLFVPDITDTEFVRSRPSFSVWLHAQTQILKRTVAVLGKPNVLLGVSSMPLLVSCM